MPTSKRCDGQIVSISISISRRGKPISIMRDTTIGNPSIHPIRRDDNKLTALADTSLQFGHEVLSVDQLAKLLIKSSAGAPLSVSNTVPLSLDDAIEMIDLFKRLKTALARHSPQDDLLNVSPDLLGHYAFLGLECRVSSAKKARAEAEAKAESEKHSYGDE